MMFRVGYGEDIHRLEKGRKLILGGVNIPSDLGAVSYSDGDALTHAICDAILGAASMGDIGRHFPDSDPQWKNTSSLIILKKVREMIEREGYRIENIDAFVCLEEPRISPYIEQIKHTLGEILGIEISRISIKAGTYEGLGIVGEKKAIICRAVVLLSKYMK